MSDRDCLLDMWQAIERIEKYTRNGREEFCTNELIPVWVAHHVAIIAESASRLSSEFIRGNPEPLWRELAALKDLLTSESVIPALDEMWRLVICELVLLKQRLAELLGKPMYPRVR